MTNPSPQPQGSWAGELLRSALLRAFAGSAFVGVLSRIALLLMAALLARQLGPEGFGTFNFAIGLATILGQLSGLGLPQLSSRLVAEHIEDGRYGRLRGFHIRSRQIVLVVAGMTPVGLFLAGQIPGLAAGIATGIVLAAPLTPLLAFRKLNRQQLIGAKRPKEGLFFDEALPPIAICAVASVMPFETPAAAVAVMAIASLAAILIGARVLRRALPTEISGADPEFHTRVWLWMALPMLVGTLSRLLLNRIDIMLIGPIAGIEAVGYYSAAFRASYLLTFLPLLLNTVLTPRFSAHHAAGRAGAQRRLYLGGVTFGIAVVLPLSAILYFGAEIVVRLVFGDAFAASAPLLRVLTISQALLALSMVSGALLMMADRHRAFAVINASALAVNIAANLFLIRQYGAMGAAYASVLSSAILLAASSIVAATVIRRGKV